MFGKTRTWLGMGAVALAFIGLILLLVFWISHWGRGMGTRAVTTLSLTDLLGDSAGGYAKVLAPRPLVFPADHGPHPAYHNEWWYFTGNLKDKQGKEFGYQLTFFRSAMSPPRDKVPQGRDSVRSLSGRTSSWASNQAYMAHFAITEVGEVGSPKVGTGLRKTDAGPPEARGFTAFERFSRAAMGLAGAESQPFHVWLEDWRCESLGGDSSFFPLRLRAAQGSVSIDLILEEGKLMVLQGNAGFSRKGPEAGNASYYYSFTRMPTKGRISTAAGEFEVSGNSWMDREWGSSILAAGVMGWEWFGLQLSDSTDLLFFRLRSSSPSSVASLGASLGEIGPVKFDYGMMVDSHGAGQVLRSEDMRGEILSQWKSPIGRTYPSRWSIEIPSRQLRMEIAPKRPDQELNLSIPYWEGAVDIKADRAGKSLGGEGYMELTGYR